MSKLGIGVMALAACVSTGAWAQDGGMILRPADQIKWGDAPAALPKGAQMAVMMGDPAKEGPFAMRVKVPANYRIAPHFHPADEAVTVISGDLRFGMGATVDEAKGTMLNAGAFAKMAKGMQHYAWSAGGAEFQVNGIGPWGITYVNPADDPRKSQ
jgi:hypothetical protein